MKPFSYFYVLITLISIYCLPLVHRNGTMSQNYPLKNLKRHSSVTGVITTAPVDLSDKDGRINEYQNFDKMTRNCTPLNGSLVSNNERWTRFQINQTTSTISPTTNITTNCTTQRSVVNIGTQNISIPANVTGLKNEVSTGKYTTMTLTRKPQKHWPEDDGHSDTFHSLSPSQRQKIIIGGYIFAVCTSLGIIWMVVSHIKTKRILQKHQDNISMNVRGKYHMVSTISNRKVSLLVTDTGHIKEIVEPTRQY